MNTQNAIYNNMSIRQILKNLPKNMVKCHKQQYIDNCIFVSENESLNYNLGMCKLVRNSNFRLIELYN